MTQLKLIKSSLILLLISFSLTNCSWKDLTILEIVGICCWLGITNLRTAITTSNQVRDQDIIHNLLSPLGCIAIYNYQDKIKQLFEAKISSNKTHSFYCLISCGIIASMASPLILHILLTEEQKPSTTQPDSQQPTPYQGSPIRKFITTCCVGLAISAISLGAVYAANSYFPHYMKT